MVNFTIAFIFLKSLNYVFVPGTSSFQLMESFGHPSSQIFQGYYGASRAIYFPTKNIKDRPKSLLFVGQIIHRKGIDILVEAFKIYQNNGGAYTLTIVGSTDPKCDSKLLGTNDFKSIRLLPFLQPDKIAELMNEHRVLVTPSRFDHWATVVCEAAACGCLLVASHQVGAAYDIIKPGINGFVFDSQKKSCVQDLAKILHLLEYILESDSAQKKSYI